MQTQGHAVRFNVSGVFIDADVSIPADATGIVLFVHGSGSSRHSPRNQFVAGSLRSQSLGTMLMDLLTPAKEHADQFSGHLRFDIRFLARRVFAIVDEMRRQMTAPLGLLAPAPVPLRHSLRRPRAPRASSRWSRAAAGQIWRGRRLLTCERRRF